MLAVEIVIGIVLGVFAAVSWQIVASRSDTQPLFAALGRSVRAMLSDEGDFLSEYGSLLLCVGSFVLWNVLALVAALAPALLVTWLFWPYYEQHAVLLIVVFSVSSMGGIIWLRRAKPADPQESHGGLSVSDSQYFFMQVVDSAPWLMRRGAAFESRLLRRRLDAIQIDRPVFVTGLARSGTTMLLELLSQAHGVATHRYRDFPFLMMPYLWNHFVNVFGARGDSVQRPHQDGISITPESPEAFEEPIWQRFFSDAHQSTHSHVLNEDRRNKAFDGVFVDHLRKMLLIRNGARYLSKGNYNVTRLEYLGSLFPDARLVVPLRHPVTHVASLVRQHELFCEYSRQDRRVPHYLTAAGHFEFGPQRVPISVNGSAEKTLAAWEAGDEHKGYALQWAAVYGYVLELLKQSRELADRIIVVRYEDICDDPRGEVSRVLEHVGLVDEGTAILDKLDHIKRSSRHATDHDATTQAVWEVTRDVATAFGYEPTAGETIPCPLTNNDKKSEPI